LLPQRLTWIDETNRHSHSFLEQGDRCLFFGEFDAGAGFAGSPTNDLVANYKRTPREIAASAYASRLQRYKNLAIREIAVGLRHQFGPADVARLTFVPIPPSKVACDPDHCDRLERTLWMAFASPPARARGYVDADIRPLLRQTRSTEPDHRSHGDRCHYKALLAITQIDAAQLITPVRDQIVLFDDVLTSGKHYKVGKARIMEVLPNHPVIGLFVARVPHVDGRAFWRSRASEP
jgi:hypothetical protein